MNKSDQKYCTLKNYKDELMNYPITSCCGVGPIVDYDNYCTKCGLEISREAQTPRVNQYPVTEDEAFKASTLPVLFYNELYNPRAHHHEDNDKHTRYKVGDRIRLVNYGHPWYFWKDGEMMVADLAPERVGQYGRIHKAGITQGIDKYSIDFDNLGHGAWYNNSQLEYEHVTRQHHPSGQDEICDWHFTLRTYFSPS